MPPVKTFLSLLAFKKELIEVDCKTSEYNHTKGIYVCLMIVFFGKHIQMIMETLFFLHLFYKLPMFATEQRTLFLF